MLQTFHQSKRFSAPPVQMQDLHLLTGAGLATLKDLEPRPAEYKMMPGYRSHFRSVWLNSAGRDLSIKHLLMCTVLSMIMITLQTPKASILSM